VKITLTIDKLNIWREAITNWSELCVEMGCKRVCVPGGLLHTYNVDITDTFYNHILVQDPSNFSLKQTEDETARRKIPFTVKIPKQRSYSRLKDLIRTTGYTLLPVWNLMTFDAELTGECNPDVRVERADSDQFPEWIAASTVGDLRHTKTQREMINRVCKKKSLHLLLAKLDNKPVGRGLLYIKDQVASIHMMSTIPEFRRKHVATTIVKHALNRLKNERIELTWLRTRKGGTGEKVYLKIGFKPILEILTYTRTPNLDRSMTEQPYH
jgi:ribosomal protein S18 acetylase RimI-like enzyme